MAKVFNGRAATEEYMSTHSLTFSTPEMTLKKFALWLGEHVNSRGMGEVPRLMLYVEEKAGKSDSLLAPDTDDSFRPTGAVADMYGDVKSAPTEQMTPPQLAPLDREASEAKFCVGCGQKLKPNAKFCTKCGTHQ